MDFEKVQLRGIWETRTFTKIKLIGNSKAAIYEHRALLVL